MATAVRHREISGRFLRDAEREFQAGDLLQASEKAWGAVAHCVKAIAREQGWPNRSHRDVVRNAGKLLALADDPALSNARFGLVEALHVNFYEDTYEEWPERVRYGVEAARALVDEMGSVRPEQKSPLPGERARVRGKPPSSNQG